MMRVSTSQLYASNLAGINRQNVELARVQKQLATGNKIESPSDDPAAATRIVDLNRMIDRNEQFKTNGDFALNRLGQSETVLDEVSATIDRVQGLVFSPLGQEASSRPQLAQQLRDELSIITDLANTRDANGDYLYAGHDVKTKPFDDSGANVAYTGDAGQRNIQIAADRRVADGNSGQEIFENTGAGRSLFRMIEDYAAVLENPASTAANVQTAIDTITPDLALAKDNLTLIRNSIASRMGMINTEQEISKQMNETLIDQRSELNDVDLAEIAMKLNQHQTSLQAAQQTFVKTQGLSLFNYI